MPPMAKRFIAVLAYFAISGQLTPQRLGDLEALERALEDEETFQAMARSIGRVLAGFDRGKTAMPEDDALQTGMPDEDESDCVPIAADSRQESSTHLRRGKTAAN